MFASLLGVQLALGVPALSEQAGIGTAARPYLACGATSEILHAWRFYRGQFSEPDYAMQRPLTNRLSVDRLASVAAQTWDHVLPAASRATMAVFFSTFSAAIK